jgi:lysophospholipase L1-like esterase
MMRKKIFSGVIGVLLVFLIAEVTVRLLGYAPLTKKKRYMLFSSDEKFYITDGVIPKDHFLFLRDPCLFWILKSIPDDEFHAVNSQGFRGREITLQKPKGALRIFCIGDSCTFGIGVKYYESYAFILENLLNQQSRKIKYEVVNAGVPGYSSLQGLRHLERDILKYKPDLVIASFGWNDAMEAIFYTDKEQKTPHKVIMSIHSFLARSKAYLFLDDIISNLITKIKLSLYKNTSPSQKLVRVPEKDFRDNLSKIYSLGKHYGFNTIFLNQPS